MKTLREFRKHSRISQETMAGLLKTTRSQIAMAEMGKRPLSKEAMNRLDSLQEFAELGERMPIEDQLLIMEQEQLLRFEMIDTWELMLAKNQYMLYMQEQKLKDMRNEYQSSFLRAKFFWNAGESLTKTGGVPVEINYFKDRQKKLQKKILTCGKIAQLRLQVSIDLLLAEARLLNQYLHPATAVTEAPM